MKEQYKQIDEHLKYEISNYGNIRFTDTKEQLKFDEFALMTYDIISIKNGIKQVRTRKNNSNYNVAVHRAVAEAFIPNPNKYKFVLFEDGNKKNCRADNLLWSRMSNNKK